MFRDFKKDCQVFMTKECLRITAKTYILKERLHCCLNVPMKIVEMHSAKSSKVIISSLFGSYIEKSVSAMILGRHENSMNVILSSTCAFTAAGSMHLITRSLYKSRRYEPKYSRTRVESLWSDESSMLCTDVARRCSL